jgi:hypothetical protein
MINFTVICRYVLLLLFTASACSESYFHTISDDVKIEYQPDGMVKIYSTDKGKQNHHFSLKLESLSNSKQNSILEVPLSFSQIDNSIVYKWSENITDEWKFVDNNIVRKLTIKKKPSIHDGNDKFIINSFFKTDLGFVTTGGYPFTFSKGIDDYEAIDNLIVDETSFTITDNNCKQFIIDKNIDYHNHKLDYSIDAKNIKYPITLIQDININKVWPDYSSRNEREVVVNGNNLVVSDYYQNSVKAYEKKNNEWHHMQTILPETLNGMDFKGAFGTKLALSKNTLAIASYDDLDCRNCNQDAVYLFKKNKGQWEQQTKIFSPDSNYKPYFGDFGTSLDLYEDKLVVSDIRAEVAKRKYKYLLYESDKERNRDSEGAVYFFQESNNEWKHTDTILPTEDNIYFGKSVALDNDTLIIGSTYNAINDKEGDYGILNIYDFKNKKWHKESQISITDLVKEHDYYDSVFAESIDISDNTIVVGNPSSYDNGIRGSSTNRRRDSLYNVNSNLTQYGQVYIFKKFGSKWKKQARLQAPNPLQLDYFGSSVKIVNDTITIGASGDSNHSPGINSNNDNCQLPSSGAIYVYKKKWNGWKQSDYIKSENPQKLEHFGHQIDSDGETIVVNSNDIHVYNRDGDSWKKTKHIKTLPTKRLQ